MHRAEVLYDSITSECYLKVPYSQKYRAFFEDKYGVPTDVDAVWADRTKKLEVKTV